MNILKKILNWPFKKELWASSDMAKVPCPLIPRPFEKAMYFNGTNHEDIKKWMKQIECKNHPMTVEPEENFCILTGCHGSIRIPKGCYLIMIGRQFEVYGEDFFHSVFQMAEIP